MHTKYFNAALEPQEVAALEPQHCSSSAAGMSQRPNISVRVGGVSTNRLLDVWETLFSFSKYFLSNTFSENIDNCSVAFSLLFSIHDISKVTKGAIRHFSVTPDLRICKVLHTLDLRYLRGAISAV